MIKALVYNYPGANAFQANNSSVPCFIHFHSLGIVLNRICTTPITLNEKSASHDKRSRCFYADVYQ